MKEFHVVIDGYITGVTKEGIEKGINKLLGWGNPLEVFNRVNVTIKEEEDWNYQLE